MRQKEDQGFWEQSFGIACNVLPFHTVLMRERRLGKAD